MNPIRLSIHELLNKNINTLPHYQQVQLSVILAKQVLPNFEQKHPNDNRPRLAIEAAEAWLADPSEENAEKAREAGDAAEVAYYAAEVAYYAAWAAASAAEAAADDARAAWAAWAAGWAAKAVDYNAKSKFYKIIPDKQEFIKMLGRSK